MAAGEYEDCLFAGDLHKIFATSGGGAPGGNRGTTAHQEQINSKLSQGLPKEAGQGRLSTSEYGRWQVEFGLD